MLSIIKEFFLLHCRLHYDINSTIWIWFDIRFNDGAQKAVIIIDNVRALFAAIYTIVAFNSARRFFACDFQSMWIFILRTKLFHSMPQKWTSNSILSFEPRILRLFLSQWSLCKLLCIFFSMRITSLKDITAMITRWRWHADKMHEEDSVYRWLSHEHWRTEYHSSQWSFITSTLRLNEILTSQNLVGSAMFIC